MAAINLDALLAKRREVLGSDHTFPVEFAGETFQFIAPELATKEWNEDWTSLREDAADGIVSAAVQREETLRLVLGGQADDFVAAAEAAGIDPLTLVGWAMEDHAEYVGKTRSRQSSNRAQRRAKQL